MLITDELTNKAYLSQRITWYKCWKNIENALKDNDIEYALLLNTKDIWVRDFMPVQTSIRKFMGYIYYPNYLKKDSNLRTDDVFKCYKFNEAECRHIDLKIDGGNVIKCNDEVIMTDKVFVENKSFSKDFVIEQIRKAMDVSEVIIIPWDKEEKYGHADGMVRYVSPGHVIINNYTDIDKPLRRKILSALSPYFDKISELSYGKNARAASWAHLNFLRIGNIIFVPQVNIPSDSMAIDQISNIYTECKVVPVHTEGIVRRGGALNCISWNIKSY